MERRPTTGAGPETTGNHVKQLTLFDVEQDHVIAPTAERRTVPFITHDVIRGRRLDGTCASHRATPNDRREGPR